MNTKDIQYGSVQIIEENLETGGTVETRAEIFSGATTRMIRIDNESVKLESDNDLATAVLSACKQLKDGKILGFNVDATKYDPKSLQVKRMIVSKYTFADK